MDELMFRAVQGSDLDSIQVARALFLEYQSEHADNPCFKSLDHELAVLPGEYSAPDGGLWLVFDGIVVAGCVALRPLNDLECEMKRLFVRDQLRGRGFGRQLAEFCIDQARSKGYARLRLDTIHTMVAARAIYEKLGFAESKPYYDEPIEGAHCLVLNL